MKIYKSQEEVNKDLVNGSLTVNDSVAFEFDLLVIKGDINAWDINAGNIKAGDINAWDISYYAVCSSYKNITCKKIEGRRNKHKHFCLDGEVIMK